MIFGAKKTEYQLTGQSSNIHILLRLNLGQNLKKLYALFKTIVLCSHDFGPFLLLICVNNEQKILNFEIIIYICNFFN